MQGTYLAFSGSTNDGSAVACAKSGEGVPRACRPISSPAGLGFIGRHVADDLFAAGHSVRILDSLVEQVHGDGRPTVPAAADVILGDCRDAGLVREALDGVTGVFHLAAEVGVGQSMYEIERYVGGNDLATAVLLQAMIDRPVQRIVVASSMSVYGEGLYRTADGARVGDARRHAARTKAGLWDLVDDAGRALEAVPTDEGKPVDLASIYALTKYFQERAVLIFGEAYGVEAVALRLFNVFGAGTGALQPLHGRPRQLRLPHHQRRGAAGVRGRRAAPRFRPRAGRRPRLPPRDGAGPTSPAR